MLRDTTDAIEMDDQYVKAFVANGEALIELGKTSPNLKMIDKGIQRIRKGFSLCTGQKTRNFEQEITNQLFKAQKIRYYKQKEFLENDKAELLCKLKNVVKAQSA